MNKSKATLNSSQVSKSNLEESQSRSESRDGNDSKKSLSRITENDIYLPSTPSALSTDHELQEQQLHGSDALKNYQQKY